MGTQTEYAHVIIDEPFWRTAERLREEEPEFFRNLSTSQEERASEEQAHTVRFGGCAILDSGASSGVTSLAAADEAQAQRISSEEPGRPKVTSSDRRFRFGDGGSGSAGKKLIQPITSGNLQGHAVDFHLIDKEGNETLPLYPISETRKNRRVVDYEENQVRFKDKPEIWHELPSTGGEKCLILIPLTKEAVEKYTPEWYRAFTAE